MQKKNTPAQRLDEGTSTITLPANAFTRANYTFKNWNTQADGSGDTYEDQATATFTTTTTLYAQWKAIAYEISYDLKGGTVSTDNPTSYDMTMTFTLNNPGKAGYTFDGWTGTGITEASTEVTIPAGSSGDRTYTANFTTITYTLTYELDGGTNNAENPTTYTVETATITLKDPTREGYEFKGWLLDGEAVTEIPVGSIANKTLTAVWEESSEESPETGGDSPSGGDSP